MDVLFSLHSEKQFSKCFGIVFCLILMNVLEGIVFLNVHVEAKIGQISSK